MNWSALVNELITVNPNLILCLGNTALWAMSGKTGVSKLSRDD